jgi:hypothetical protein
LRTIVLSSLAAGLATTSCSAIFHLDEYSTRDLDGSLSSGNPGTSLPTAEDGGTSGDAGHCVGPSCTGGACIAFDNVSRIQGFTPDASLPPLPAAGAGAGTSDAGGADANKSGDAGDAGTGNGAQDASSATLPLCSSLPRPVYVIGSSGLTSIAEELGALASTSPITLIYTIAHSCDGAKSIVVNQTAFDTGATTANYWDVAGTTHLCQLDAASQYADIGLSNVFADQCLSLPQGAAGIGDFRGPVTPGTVVAPNTSTQATISAEALYYVVGLGTGAVAPWTSNDYLFVNPSSGVQLDFGLAIGVPAARWKGTVVASATQNIAKVAASLHPDETLGTMGTDLVEAANTSSTIKELAYQDFGQDCAYYPNSTATSADKRNVRDGRYPIWGFTHMFTKVNAQSVPLNPDAATIIGYFTGNIPTPTGNFLKYVITDHLVPMCAMRVTRSAEMGVLSPYTPSPSCGCYFDSIAMGSSSCDPCSTSANCPSTAPHCNLGYCEAN